MYGIVQSYLDQIKALEVERDNLLQILAMERDAFGTIEILLKQEITRLNNDVTRLDHENHKLKAKL